MNTLRAIRAPLLVLLALEGVGAASLMWSAQSLPAKVATHFNFQGQPDGWMSRTLHLEVMGAFGLLFPLFLVGIGFLTAVLPAGSVNVPNRDYWLSPEHRRETNCYLVRHMAWLACVAMGLFIPLNWFIVEANRTTPPRMTNGVWLLVSAFLAFVVAWIVVLAKHFSRPPRDTG